MPEIVGGRIIGDEQVYPAIGQFFDLIEIFKIGGWCPDTNYLFLGEPPPPFPPPEGVSHVDPDQD